MFYDPRGQVVRTLNPDGSEQRVIYGVPGSIAHPDVACIDENDKSQIKFEPTPWEAYTYDANDLAPLSTAPDGDLAGKPCTSRSSLYAREHRDRRVGPDESVRSNATALTLLGTGMSRAPPTISAATC